MIKRDTLKSPKTALQQNSTLDGKMLLDLRIVYVQLLFDRHRSGAKIISLLSIYHNRILPMHYVTEVQKEILSLGSNTYH